MSVTRKLAGSVSAAALLFVSLAPAVHAADSAAVFGGDSTDVEVLPSDEMDTTEGQIVCGGACTVGFLVVGGFAAGYQAGKALAD